MDKTKRYYELDFLRCIPMLLLPFVHSFGYVARDLMIPSASIEKGMIWEYLCAMGPSVFIILAGMNLAFSCHTSPRELVKRGFIMLIANYSLNFLRFLLPSFIADVIYGTYWYYTIDGALSMFCSDILIFAAGMFFFFALMKKLKLSPLSITMITLVMLTLNTVFSQSNEFSGLHEFIGCFIHYTPYSAFPWLSWMIFPAIGYQLGCYMKTLGSQKELRRFYNQLMLVSVVVFAATFVVLEDYDLNALLISASPANDFVTDLFNVLLDASLSCLIIGSATYSYSLFRSKKTDEFFETLSGALTVFYYIHWIIVAFVATLIIPRFRGTEELAYWQVMLFALFVSVSCIFISLPISKKLNKRKQARRVSAEKAAIEE